MIADRERESLTYRPAFAVFAALCFGVWFATIFVIPFWLLSVVICLLLLSLLLHVSRPLKNTLLLCAAICIGFLINQVNIEIEQHSKLASLALQHPGTIIAYGTISEAIDSGEYSARTVLDCDSIRIGNNTLTINERLNLIIKSRPKLIGAPLPLQGEYISAYLQLTDVFSEHNPYEGSIRASRTRRNDATAVGIVDNPYDIYDLKAPVTRSITYPIITFFSTIHTAIAQRLAACIKDSLARSIAAAVVLGDKNELSRTVTVDFRNAGLSHILVVSGFNVGIVALMVFYLLRLFWIVHLKTRIIISMIVVALYSMTIGLEPSVLRAFWAVEFVFLARLLERKPDIGNITAMIAAVNIILFPSQLFDPSFQLTYGAVFSLVIIYPPLEQVFIPEAWKNSKGVLIRGVMRISDIFIASTAVTIGLAPIMLAQFHSITILSLASNIIGIPLATLITIISFLLIPLSYLSVILVSIYSDVVTILSHSLVNLATVSSNISLLRFTFAALSIPGIILYIFFIRFVILQSPSWKRVVARTIVSIVFLWTISSSGITLVAKPITTPGDLSVIFFDVGQGDAALIKTPNGKSYLVDLGGIKRDGTVVAEQAIVPMLAIENNNHLDAAMITHMHLDHFGGALSILSACNVDRLFVSGFPGRGYYITVFDSIIHAKHIAIDELYQGKLLKLDSNISMYLLNPDTAMLHNEREENGNVANHTSLAMKIVYGKTSFLFLGDIEASDEERLARRYGKFLESDIVKVAHHGSRYSSSKLLTETVHPKYAVISVGEGNTFGHPTTTALSRWHTVGSQILRTDREGAIVFHSDGNTIAQDEWRK